jgi:hypothetical protein
MMHEAIALGTIVILGDNITRYFTPLNAHTGFVNDAFETQNYTLRQLKQLKFLVLHYADTHLIMRKNIQAILSHFKRR